MTRAPLLAAMLGAAASAMWPTPAPAMCGGNIFATCAPSPNAAGAEAARLKREKRLEAVRTKKRRYPLGSR